MKRLYPIFIFSLMAFSAGAQNFPQQFKELVVKKDTLAQLKLLQKWEKNNPDEAELYTAWFNFYADKSVTEVLSLDKKPRGEGSFVVKDANDSTAFYINGNTGYNPKYIKLAFEHIDRGIAKFPQRLDMRFGKTYLLGKLEDYGNFTKEIVKAITYGYHTNNKWTWTNNEPLEDAEQFMLASVQDYSVQIYNTNNDALLHYMRQIAETVLKYKPNHIESLSNLSIVQMLNKEYDNALASLKKAEKTAPEDYVILSNIAQAYRAKGDKKNALKYYELTAKYGDEDVKAFVKKQIEKLNQQ